MNFVADVVRNCDGDLCEKVKWWWVKLCRTYFF